MMMVSKFSLSGVSFIILTVLLIAIVSLLLIVSKSYFNSTEINLLVEKAEEQDLEYEVIIHNQWLNTYSFFIPDQTGE
jgi:capsular polysaccharide biosynthesis protein